MRWLTRFIGHDPDDDTMTDPTKTSFPMRPPTARPAPAETRGPALETGERCIAAIGDLHGRSDLLHRVTRFLDALAERRPGELIEVYLGDYVDRGADSRGVIETLATRRATPGRDVVCLAGNHEAMLLGALRSDSDFTQWLEYGGQTTLKSYGVAPPRTAREIPLSRMAFVEAIPPAHIEFLRSLELSFRYQNFFFAHAGVRPGTPLDQQNERDLLWIRDAFLRSTLSFGAVVVHGHTPVPRPVLQANRISIDTGAYQSGVLTCAMITSTGVRFLNTRGADLQPDQA